MGLEWVLSNKLTAKDYIFFGKDGPSTPISENALRKNTEKHFDMAGMPKIRIHDFRHSHICNLIDAGVKVKAVSARVGHKDSSITSNIYDHVTKKKQEQLNDALENLYTKQPLYS